jgi:hypothetical protein
MDRQRTFEWFCRYLRRNYFAYFLLNRICILIVCSAGTLAASAVAGLPPCEAPISRSDVRQIARVIREVTSKPILAIMGITADSYVPGAVTGHEYIVDIKTGKRTPQSNYIRTDRVSVYMHYSDRSHVDVYIVRKVCGRWKIESKKDWFL